MPSFRRKPESIFVPTLDSGFRRSDNSCVGAISPQWHGALNGVLAIGVAHAILLAPSVV